MSIFSQEDEQLTRERSTRNIALEKPTGFQENMSAAWKEFNNNDSYGSLRAQRREAWDERIKKVQELTGQKLDTPWNRFGEDNFFGSMFFGPTRDLMFDPDHLRENPEEYDAVDRAVLPHMPETLSGVLGRMFDGVDNDLTEPQRLRKHEEELDRLRESLPPDQRNLIPTRDEIEQQLKDRAKKLESDSADIGQRSTLGGMAGRLVGAGGASLTQPEVLITLPIGAPVRAGVLGRVLIEAGIGAGTEAVLQPGVQQQRDELGLKSGLGPALENIATAGLGAGGLTAAGIGVGAALKLISKGGVSAFEKAVGRKATAEERSLVQQYQRDSDIEAQSPYEENTAAAYRVQQQNEQIGYEAALDGRELGEADIVSEPALMRKAIEDDGVTIQTLRNADLKDIGVDAELMQFKAGGDDAGVTERLRGVTEWVPERAGVSLVYEFEDGSRIIADGHQRLGLAKRLAEQGQDIELPTLVLREADGVSPAEARARAAFKNIAEGTGSAQDAAKVLRDMGATPAEMGLPPRSALVRDAEGLTALDDETFGMVINDVLSEQFGAIVGRLVDDPRLQPEIARLLVKLKPANAAEADSIVRQAREAGVTRETQSSLFGDEEVVQSLYLEKARVLDRGMKMIRRNIDTFKTLNERGSDISSEGNILNEASNAQRLETERLLKTYLQAQAHRKGPIGDALTEAARKAKETGQYAGPSREFVAAVTRGINEGEIDGDAISGGRLDPQSQLEAAQGREQASDFEQIDDRTIQMFDDPNGKAAEDQALGISRELLQPEQSEVLDFAVPFGERIDSDGNRVAETQSIRDAMAGLEEDQEFFEQLKLCDGGGRS